MNATVVGSIPVTVCGNDFIYIQYVERNLEFHHSTSNASDSGGEWHTEYLNLLHPAYSTKLKKEMYIYPVVSSFQIYHWWDSGVYSSKEIHI